MFDKSKTSKQVAAIKSKMGEKKEASKHITDLTPDRDNPKRRKELEDKFRKMGAD